MNEYRAQRLKEDLTFAQQRNKRQRQQLANYKKVHEKDLKEIERLNNIINELEKRLEQAIEELENIPINANGGDILESERKVYHILKGSDKE